MSSDFGGGSKSYQFRHKLAEEKFFSFFVYATQDLRSVPSAWQPHSGGKKPCESWIYLDHRPPNLAKIAFTDVGRRISKTPALRAFVAGGWSLATTLLYLVQKSNPRFTCIHCLRKLQKGGTSSLCFGLKTPPWGLGDGSGCTAGRDACPAQKGRIFSSARFSPQAISFL